MRYLIFMLFCAPMALYAADTAVRADTVDVRDANATSQQLNAFSQKVVIDRQQIDNMGVVTVGDVLGKLPGVEAFNGGHRARGMSRDSVQMLVDGERQSGGTMGMLSRLPASEIERVEIHRGNSAEFGGASAISVNVVLKKAITQQASEYKLGLGVRKDEPNYQVSYTWNGGDKDFSWSLPFTLYSSRTPVNTWQYKDSTAPQFNWQEQTDGISRMSHYGVSPKLVWKFGRDSITLMPMAFLGPSSKDSEANIQADPPGTSFRRLHEDVFSRIYRLRMNADKYFGESKLISRLSFNHRLNDSNISRYSNEPSGFVFGSFNNINRENELNASLRFDHPWAEHYLSFSAELNNLRRADEQAAASLAVAFGNTSSQSIEHIIWFQDAWNLNEQHALTSGLRLEQIRLSSNGSENQTSALLPSIAYRWQIDPHYVMRSSLGAGLKTPKLNEITNAAVPSVGINTPLDADVRGNPNLKPERNINFELALERYLGDKNSVLSVNGYVRSTQNFTERIISQEGNRWIDRPQNVGDSVHWGLELDAKLKTDGWAWQGGTLRSHLLIPRNSVQDQRLDLSRRAKETPVYTLSFGLDQTIPQWKSSFGVDVQISGRSETALPNEQYAFTKARTLLDGYFLYQLDSNLNLRIVGRNLLSADTRNRNRFLTATDDWMYRISDYQYPSLMVFLEGKI